MSYGMFLSHTMFFILDIRCIVILLIVNNISIILTEDCADDWVEHDGRCYLFSKTTESRGGAKEQCKHKGGILASAATEEVNNFFHKQVLNNGGNHWIGLIGSSQPSNKGEWHWLNSSKVLNTLWYKNEPTGESSVCGKLGVGEGSLPKSLGNKGCEESLGYICESDVAPQNSNWENYGGHWYLFSNRELNFIPAMNICFNESAYLATVESLEELTFFRNWTTTYEHYWVGLTTLHWLDDSPISLSNFENHHEISGNNPCVYFHTSNNKWESTNDCDQSLKYICQKASQVTTTIEALATHDDALGSSIKTTDLIPNVTTEDPYGGDNEQKEQMRMEKDEMPMIAGIVAGIVIAIILVVVIVILLYRRRKLSHAKAEIALVDDNFSPSSADDTIQPYGTSAVVEDNDMQPYGTSEIQPYGTSDMKTIEDNALNHKYESEGVSPYNDDVNVKDKKNALIPLDVKQQLPVYAVVNKPKDKLDPNSSKGGSERTTKSSGSSSCDNNSLTINTNINNMPVYAVVDIVKKKTANAKEWNAEQRSCKSADDANTPIVETNKNEILVDDILPVYAVVDKTKKNLTSVPKQIKDQQNQPEKQNINTISVPTDGPIYAVVDKNKKIQSPKPIPPAKPSAIEIQNTEIDDISTHIYSECENINNTVGYAEFDIQEGTEESNKFSVAAENDYAEVQFID